MREHIEYLSSKEIEKNIDNAFKTEVLSIKKKRCSTTNTEFFAIRIKKENTTSISYIYPSDMIGNVYLNGLNLRHLQEDDKTEEICVVAVKQNVKAIHYVPLKFRTFEMYRFILQQDGLLLEIVPMKFFSDAEKNDKFLYNLYEIAIEQNGLALEFIPDLKIIPLCNHFDTASKRNFIWKAIKKNPKALKFVPEERISDEMIECCIERDPFTIKFVPKEKITDSILTKTFLTFKKSNKN